MDVKEFVRIAIINLYPELYKIVSDKKLPLHYESQLEFFTYQLRSTGVKVVIKTDDFVLHPKMGVLPRRVMTASRVMIKKSLALYRSRKQKKYTVKGITGIMDVPCILIDKESMIRLQLTNNCSRVVVFLLEKDIWSDTKKARFINDDNAFVNGYFISGKDMGIYNLNHMIREVNMLTVQIIRTKKNALQACSQS